MKPLMQLVTEMREYGVKAVQEADRATRAQGLQALLRADALEVRLREWAAEVGANDDGMWSGRDKDKFIEFHRDILGVSPPLEKGTCVHCSGVMKKQPDTEDYVLMSNPPQRHWRWVCGCGHSEYGGTERQPPEKGEK